MTSALLQPQIAGVQAAVDGGQTATTRGPASVPRLAIVSTSEALLDTFFTPEEQATIEARLHALAISTASSGVSTPASQARDAGCTRDSSHPLYCIYTVQPGDTLSAIAGEYGLSSSGDFTAAEMLAQSNKPEVVDSDDIKPGQKLRVPVSNGIIHTAFVAESLAEVAAQYGVTVDEIQAVEVNNAGSFLSIGQEVLIPGPSELPAQAAVTPSPTATPEPTKTPEPTPTPEPTQVAVVAEAVEEEQEMDQGAANAQEQTLAPPPIISSTATATPIPATATPTKAPATATPTPSPAARSAGGSTGKGALIWPISGPISSYMGPSHPLGIDIDLFNNEGVPVGASAAGTVTFAGGNPCCSYGYYVIVDHGNGITTLYAHFSKIAVKEGQKVSQGQTVGYGGSTGYATGTHLHFEVRLNGNVVDPLGYLPK